MAESRVMTAKTPIMNKAPQSKPGEDTFMTVQRIIAETTGIDAEDITLDADLEEDLGINMMSEFPLIVTKIKKEIPDVYLSTQELMECATVAELIELVDEERDL